MNKVILIIIVILIVIVGGYFLLRGAYQAPALAPTTPAPTAPTEEVSPGPEEVSAPTPSVKEFTVSGTEYNFNPSSIRVSAGDRVKITFRNDGRIGHNFVVKDLGISAKTIGSGQTDIVEFTAPQSGNYTFICSVPGHATAGMAGDLIVE